VVESATVTDSNGDRVELSNLRPDGTLEPASVDAAGDEAAEEQAAAATVDEAVATDEDATQLPVLEAEPRA
jgi:hypothetical protein